MKKSSEIGDWFGPTFLLSLNPSSTTPPTTTRIPCHHHSPFLTTQPNPFCSIQVALDTKRDRQWEICRSHTRAGWGPFVGNISFGIPQIKVWFILEGMVCISSILPLNWCVGDYLIGGGGLPTRWLCCGDDEQWESDRFMLSKGTTVAGRGGHWDKKILRIGVIL